MISSKYKLLAAVVAFAGIQVHAACEPEISFPAPEYNNTTLDHVFKIIDGNLNTAIAAGDFDGTSFSLEISSSRKTMHTKYHFDESLGGSPINESSIYRIASNTKVFTALGIIRLEAAGKLSLDDEVTDYIPKLLDGAGKISWKGITIRSLLSHSSGIPDNCEFLSFLNINLSPGTDFLFGQDGDEDLALLLPDPSVVGLPPLTEPQSKQLPKCGAYTDYKVPCTADDFVNGLHQLTPVFAPQKESSYSNVGFDLLGQVISNVSRIRYEDYITKTIINPLGLHNTSFDVPDSLSAASAGPNSDWGHDAGAGNPGGGLYSSSSDMIKFLRWILSNYKHLSPTLNWLQPAAWNTGSHSLLGYPWEIFRTTDILPNTKRPVTFYTKGGGLTGYYSYSIIIPQYNIVLFMAVAGDLTTLNTIFTQILNPLVIAAEAEAMSQLKDTYAGVYESAKKSLNSSITLTQTDPRALHITSWISNSTDVLASLIPLVAAKAGTSGDMYLQLQPTFEKKHRDGLVGEVWRFINVIDDYDFPTNATTVWNDYCVSNVDPLSYGTVPLNEAVFWRKSTGSNSPVTDVTLSAFRFDLKRK
ncbi:unnamed protein product [Penicillium salamii]|uniref:Beta-lactamase-related domain-containing protein n=1 Tax=Penicillium salamii TaxID=1612424 RepID=A0A9W4J8U5_9EURO|nr:unnamed protein product [Penicillium salamii]CAG8071929.1 unnamed protein product [Penicillium salamii]CAG8171612.1 unnamed protein product [Penicillium salamii]CAG8229168.1 unnamed protein product [Penicillium salamii]CAG8308335.1 unnamed protein product [Penicillium salamii]